MELGGVLGDGEPGGDGLVREPLGEEESTSRSRGVSPSAARGASGGRSHSPASGASSTASPRDRDESRARPEGSRRGGARPARPPERLGGVRGIGREREDGRGRGSGERVGGAACDAEIPEHDIRPGGSDRRGSHVGVRLAREREIRATGDERREPGARERIVADEQERTAIGADVTGRAGGRAVVLRVRSR